MKDSTMSSNLLTGFVFHFLLLTSLSCHASQWQIVGGSDDASLDKIYIDLDSIRQDGDYRTAVFLTVYEKPRINIKKLKLDRHVQKTAIDCTHKTFSLISTIGYLDGKQVGSSPDNANWKNDFKPVPQNPFSQRSLTLVCDAILAKAPQPNAAQSNFVHINPTLTPANPKGSGETDANTVRLKDDSTAKLDGNTDLGKLAPNQTIQVPLTPQAWQVRRAEFTQAVNALSRNPSDPQAHQVIDRVLSEYQRNPLGRTPMEAMDILGAFYLPKEGVKKVMPLIVLEAVFGWYDTLQWASESGKAEIVNNEKFLGRAFFIGGGKKVADDWSAVLKDDPELAKKLVDDALHLATLHHARNDLGYDRKWPAAYGLEKMMAAMNGKPEPPLVVSPRMATDAAWTEAVTRVRSYYLPEQEKTAHAGWIDPNGKPVPETDSMKSADGFGAHLVLTTNESDFIKSWSQPQDPPVLKVDNTVRRGKPITAMIIFGGCKANADGKCNVTVKYKMVSPDGTASETESSPVWLSVAPQERIVQLGDTRLRTVINKDDPLGKYQVIATVVDNISGTVLKLASVFNAIK